MHAVRSKVASSPPALDAFLTRVDAFCRDTGWPETRVSRALFNDDERVSQVRRTHSDMGVKRLARAEADLTKMAAEAGITLPHAVENGESDPARARPRAVGE